MLMLHQVCQAGAGYERGDGATVIVARPAAGCTGRPFPAGLFYSRGLFLEQPGVNVVRDGLEPRVVDALSVDTGHVVAGVAHDEIKRNLVLGLTADGFKSVSQGVEISVAVDAQRGQ